MALNTNQHPPIDLSTLIACVDFDGTVVTHSFPEVGRDIGAQPVLRKLVDAGTRLILWTMRSPEALPGHTMGTLTDAVKWFEENGIPLWGINSNPQQHWSRSPKAFAHVYIDDAALGCPLIYPQGERPHVDWQAIDRHFFPNPTPIHNDDH